MGYEIEGSFIDEKFDTSVFLKDRLNRKPKFRKFELYPEIYSMNDDGKIGGVAVMKEEEFEVPADDVMKIDLLKSVHDNDELKGVPVFSRKIINVMKRKLMFSDEISGGSWTYIAFNYDPNIQKEKLHQMLLKYINGIAATKKVGPLNEVLKSNQIVFVASYSD